MQTFEDYLRKEYDGHRGKIDFALRVNMSGAHPRFYIHASGHNSETLDYAVVGNELRPLKHGAMCSCDACINA